ncbi:MAG: aminotransferase class I/II-fold pyridoxal phosphate-dependent enzyme [Acidobacteriota bacterium]
MAFDPRDVEICVGAEAPTPEPTGTPIVPPIVQTSLFAFPTLDDLLTGLGAEHRHSVYSRGQNPTVEVLEDQLAALERGAACKCFASGMAAISAALLGLLEAGDHVLFVNQVYGPTLQLAAELERFGITHDVVLDLELGTIENALRPTTRLIWCESPGTMLFRTLDLEALTALARGRGILTAIDNTWATPLLQKPLTLGFDLVLHALSKYIGGHSDVIGGALVGSSELLEKLFYRAFLLLGGILPPFDAWLVVRGLRTLPIRLRQHQESALAIARHLTQHPAIGRVWHPGLEPALPTTLSGTSGLFSFELADGSFDAVRGMVDRLRLFRIGVSWGGPESLVIAPNRGDNTATLQAHGIPGGLIRLSVGLEPAERLIDDLDQALAEVA